MYSRETFTIIADYVKSEKGKSIKDKCALFNMRPTVYYKLCKKFGIDGKMGTRKPKKALSEKEVRKVIAKNREKAYPERKGTLSEEEASDREGYTSNEDDSE